MNGTINQQYFDEKIAELERYAKTPGVAGVHFDYLRFSGSAKYNNTAEQNPGGMEAITEFVKQATTALRNINPNLTISAALMPEIDHLKTWYGDDYSEISKYLDVVMPMIYTGNFKQTTQWVENITRWFVENSQNAEVWTGLQAYVSDNDLTLTPVSKMNMDIQSSLNGGASGAVLFRIGYSKNIDFTNITVNDKEITSLSYLRYLLSAPSLTDTVTLENDFFYTEEFDKDYEFKLSLKNMVINLNNHTIEGLDNILLNITKFENVTVINGEKATANLAIDSVVTRQAVDYAAGERGGMLYATLTDGNGNPLANKTVQISINGNVYNKTTDENGNAGLQINFANANAYTVAVAFLGDKYCDELSLRQQNWL